MNAVLNINQEKGGKVRFPKFNKKVIAVGAAAGIAMGAAGIAAAYFTSSGSGSSTATVGKASAFTVSVSSCTGTALTPGYGSETCAFTVANPATAGSQSFGTAGVVVTHASTGGVYNKDADTGLVATCKSTWFSAVVTTTPTPHSITGGSSATGGVVTITMPANTSVNQSSCETVHPKITVTANA